MWGHDLVAGFAGLVLSFVAPLANPAFVAPAYSSSNYGYGSSGSVDCTLTVSQSGVSAGTAAQVTWTTSGASTATMSQDGSPAVSVALSGSVPVTITRNTSLSLTARNQYGAFKTCTAAITVSTNSSAPSCGLSPTPGVHYAGQQLQLVWYTQNATAAQISNVGAVPSNQLVQGSITITPTNTTLYTMTVSNPSGSRTCSALVSINQRPTTNYQPVTTQQVTYRPTTSGTPSYSSPRSYPTYTYPSSSGSGSGSSGSRYTPGQGLGYGSYGGNGGSSYSYPGSEGWDSFGGWDAPSYSNGLGDWTLTSTWNHLGTGEGWLTNQNCYGNWCDSEPNSWAYATPLGYDGYQEFNVGSYDIYGNNSQTTYDTYGNVIGTNRSISNEEFDNTPSDWNYGTSDLTPDGGNGLDAYWNGYSNTGSGSGYTYPDNTSSDNGLMQMWDTSNDIQGWSGQTDTGDSYWLPQYPDWGSDNYGQTHQYEPSQPYWVDGAPPDTNWNGGTDPYQSGVLEQGQQIAPMDGGWDGWI